MDKFTEKQTQEADNLNTSFKLHLQFLNKKKFEKKNLPQVKY